MSGFADFIEQHCPDVTLAPWQVALVEQVERVMSTGGNAASVVMHAPRYPGKRRAAALVGAMWEFEGRRWDAVASDPDEERRMRREARELAAALGEVFGPTPPEVDHA